MPLVSEYSFVSLQHRNTLHEDLRKFICCRRHKFAIKASIVEASGFYIVDSDVQPSNNALCFRCKCGYANESQCYVTRVFPVLFTLVLKLTPRSRVLLNKLVVAQLSENTVIIFEAVKFLTLSTSGVPRNFCSGWGFNKFS